MDKTPHQLAEDRFVLCEGYRRLRQLILDYAEGRVSGHSFLLAGHRGAGKTLLAHFAVQMARWSIEESGEGHRTAAAIPFLVPLHGPDLLRDPGPENDIRPKASHPLLPNPPDEERTARNAMREVAYALHRSFTEEILQRFARKADSPDLSAYLKVELNGHPDISTLVGVWKRAGLLQAGVLERQRPKRVIGGSLPERASQGRRELVALHTLVQVVQFLSQTHQDSVKMPEVAGVHVQLQPPILKSVMRLLRPTISVAAGLIAALMMTKENQGNWYLPGAIFLITTILTNRFLQVFGGTLSDPAIVDQNTLASLDRSIPLLVNRVFDAGFAPIFVIDELDKVNPLDEPLRAFMRQLKYFVTDRAMFCFLCDREYFERFNLEIARRLDPYPVETTYFGDRLLIHYHPSDIDKYLRSAFVEPADPDQVGLFALFLYVAKYHSRVHPDRLRRYLRAHYEPVPGVPGRYLHRVGEDRYWRNPGIRMNIFVQVAIEHIYHSREVQQRIQLENEFSAWVLDALYYIVSCWEKQEPVNLSGNSFLNHLRAHVGHGDIGPFVQDPVRIHFLRKQAERVVRYLAYPRLLYLDLLRARDSSDTQSLHHRYREQPGFALILLLVALSRPLLECEDGAPFEDQRLQWDFDSFGSPLRARGRPHLLSYVDSIASNDSQMLLQNRLPEVFEFDRALREIWDVGYLEFCKEIRRTPRPTQSIPHFVGEKPLELMEEADHAIWLLNHIVEGPLRRVLGEQMIVFMERRIVDGRPLDNSIREAGVTATPYLSSGTSDFRKAKKWLFETVGEKQPTAKRVLAELLMPGLPPVNWSRRLLELWKLAREASI